MYRLGGVQIVGGCLQPDEIPWQAGSDPWAIFFPPLPSPVLLPLAAAQLFPQLSYPPKGDIIQILHRLQEDSRGVGRVTIDNGEDKSQYLEFQSNNTCSNRQLSKEKMCKCFYKNIRNLNIRWVN